jgi:hypothetical protein
MARRKYGPKAQAKVHKVMKEFSRKQAVAIGLAMARRAGAKVPRRRKR